MAGFKAITLRLKPAEAEKVKEAADAAGESVAGYILQAIRSRMSGGRHDFMNNEYMTEAAVQIATEAAKAADQDVASWVQDAIQEQQAREQRAAELRRDLEIRMKNTEKK